MADKSISRIPPPDSPVIAAFRHWAAAVRHANEGGIAEPETDRRADKIGAAEAALFKLPSIYAVDLAAKMWVAALLAGGRTRPGEPAVLAGGDYPSIQSLAADLARLHPDLAVIARGSDAAVNP